MTGMSNVSKLAGEPSGQEFLVFTLGDEEYGIDILKVQEIRGYDQVTRIANTPAFIKGVTNLRGVIVPIVDLRVKFCEGDVEYDDNTVVIVLNLGQRVVGIVVDGVSDVLSLTAEQIRPAPEFAVTLSTEYLTGLGALGERMLILVNIENCLTAKRWRYSISRRHTSRNDINNIAGGMVPSGNLSRYASTGCGISLSSPYPVILHVL